MNEALDAFEARLVRYHRDIEELKIRVGGVRRAATLWSLQRPFAGDPIHAAAVSDLSALADQVTASVSNAEPAALVRVVRLVLAEKRSDDIAYWSLVALEGLVSPWLSSLTTEDAAAIYDEYAEANPRGQCLPNQLAVRKQLQRLRRR
jgi:hypothetical protein